MVILIVGLRISMMEKSELIANHIALANEPETKSR
jgi:hypothetical protein